MAITPITAPAVLYIPTQHKLTALATGKDSLRRGFYYSQFKGNDNKCLYNRENQTT